MLSIVCLGIADIVQVTEGMASGVSHLTGEVDMLAGGLGLVDGAEGGLMDVAEAADEKIL